MVMSVITKESQTIKVKYSISTDNIGSECEDVIEFERGYWNSLSEEQKESEMRELAFNHLSWYWSVEE